MGFVGLTGERGPIGFSGKAGPPGLDGLDGTPGQPGLSGRQGPKGYAGLVIYPPIGQSQGGQLSYFCLSSTDQKLPYNR